MKAEIEVKYHGIELTVCGDYDSEEFIFTSNIQILHNGTDLGSIVDADVMEMVISRADAAYKEYLLERNR